MSTVGKGQLSLRKQDVITQKNLGVGIAKLEFAHKATGGESTLDLTALVAPTEMLSNGFVQPSLGSLSDANIYIYRHNLTLISSLRGKLLDYLAYTVASNTLINFQGFTLEENEIIVGVLDPMPRNNLMVVDGQAIVATGDLGVGLTDFNAGTPFEIDKYSSQQVGAVLVYRNGALQERCVGNDALNAGDYTEVQVTGGMGSLIRFKVAPVGTPDKIVVVSNGAYFERPVDSQMAAIENLGGQMDKVIQEVAILSGLPTTDFQSNPNEVDLRQFGDRVLALENPADTQATNGYTTLPGGVIMQWGKLTGVSLDQTFHSVTFPIAFPNAVFNIQASLAMTAPVSGNIASLIKSDSITTSGFDVAGDHSTVSGTGDIYWTAIGN